MERPGKRKANTTGASEAISKQAGNADKLPPQKSGMDGSDDAGKQVEDRFHHLFGFRTSDLKSWNSFVRLMSRPTDPASLAYIRLSFGLLMLSDVFMERGLSRADQHWGDTQECRFPLFDFIQPLPLHLMVLLYLVMIIGTTGIVLGVNYRVCCIMHLLPHWYILLLEKSRWNNHSYLFGILSFLLLLSDANRYWSLDGFFSSKIRNADVPLWNYALLRTQVFLVYFLAGLKKLDLDWISGYSMTYLSSHWVFYPFTLVMTTDQVDWFVVHLGGLCIDLFVGFLLFFDKTRPLGVLICVSFNFMNSQIFSIGMFPYAMMALTPMFFHTNWPRAIFRLVPRALRVLTPDDDEDDRQPSEHCLYTKEQAKPELMSTPENKETLPKELTPPTRPSFRHHAAAVFTVFFILLQLFLPYSHFITKGYNSWTQGLYGYSWDMMVHSRNLQHVRITFVDKDTGEQGYLDPEVWTKSTRWSYNPDMIKQYARCIARHLQQHDIHDVELYFDVWVSLNHRFQQRIVNPHVDIMTAEWSIFKTTPWMMPLLVDLSDWRRKLTEIEDKLLNSSHLYETVFVADFPGMYLENYVNMGIGNFTISVLKGHVMVEVIPEEGSLSEPYNISVLQGHEAEIPTGVFHNVHTVSEEPSCYMYSYINIDEATFLENLKEFELSLNGSLDNPVPTRFVNDPKVSQYMDVLKAKKEASSMATEISIKKKVYGFLMKIYTIAHRGLTLIKGALWSMFTGRSYYAFLVELNRAQNKTSDNTAG